jgi:hypothetical protein
MIGDMEDKALVLAELAKLITRTPPTMARTRMTLSVAMHIAANELTEGLPGMEEMQAEADRLGERRPRVDQAIAQKLPKARVMDPFIDETKDEILRLMREHGKTPSEAAAILGLDKHKVHDFVSNQKVAEARAQIKSGAVKVSLQGRQKKVRLSPLKPGEERQERRTGEEMRVLEQEVVNLTAQGYGPTQVAKHFSLHKPSRVYNILKKAEARGIKPTVEVSKAEPPASSPVLEAETLETATPPSKPKKQRALDATMKEIIIRQLKGGADRAKLAQQFGVDQMQITDLWVVHEAEEAKRKGAHAGTAGTG